MTLTRHRTFVPMPAVLVVLGLILLLAVMASLSLAPLLAGALSRTATSPANGLVAFDRGGDIYVVDPAPGSEPRAIVTGPDLDVLPYWSPDGQRLMFVRYADQGPSLMVTDPDGAEPMALMDTPLVEPFWFEWTPRSDGLVVSSAGPGGGAPSITIVPADGSGERVALHGAVESFVDFPVPRPVTGEGIELLYRSLQDPDVGQLRFAEVATDGAVESAGPALSVEDIAGVRTTGFAHTYDFLNPTWASSGDRFAFHTLNDVTSAVDGNGFRVHVARFDPSATPVGQDDVMVEYSASAWDEGWPVWSPDGSRLAFQSHQNGRARLVIMSAPDGGTIDPSSAIVTEHLVGVDPGSLAYAWAPDGGSLILVNRGVPSDTAFLVDADSGAMLPLGWRSDESFSWQPSAS